MKLPDKRYIHAIVVICMFRTFTFGTIEEMCLNKPNIAKDNTYLESSDKIKKITKWHGIIHETGTNETKKQNFEKKNLEHSVLETGYSGPSKLNL